MNLKMILISLSLLSALFIGIAWHQQNKNLAKQTQLAEQQKQHNIAMQQWQSSQEQHNQQRLSVIDKQRQQTFRADDSKPTLTSEKTPTAPESIQQKQQRGLSQFCDMHQTYAKYLMQNYQNNQSLPDNSKTTDLLEKQFLEGVLQRLQAFPKVTEATEQQKISEQFVQQEHGACLQFFENLGQSSPSEKSSNG